jgi:hypothetical protein
VAQRVDLLFGVAGGPVGAAAVLHRLAALGAQAVQAVAQFVLLLVVQLGVLQLVLDAAGLAVALLGPMVGAVALRLGLAEPRDGGVDQLAVGIADQEAALGVRRADPGIAAAVAPLVEAVVLGAIELQPLVASREIGRGLGDHAGLGAGLGVVVQPALGPPAWPSLKPTPAQSPCRQASWLIVAQPASAAAVTAAPRIQR